MLYFKDNMKGDNMLTQEEQIKRGEKIIEIFGLKEDKQEKYNPKRYLTSWGNKTALGVFLTCQRLIEEKV
jgi:hypothetical protein